MRRALLVGIDQYAGSRLAGCVSDANALGQLLRSNADGSPNFDCKVLSAPPESITRASLKDSVQQLLGQEADVALLFYSGHGTENNLGGYLVTPDATTYDAGVAMSDVLSLANQSPVKEIVIILDCCHSGGFGALPTINNTNANIREGVSVLTASRASQAAVETGGRGLFTSLVCSALDGGAADVIGRVTVAGVYAYVDQSLGPWDQRPLFKSHVSKLIPLRTCRPDVPLDVLRRLPEWFGSPLEQFGLDPSFEPEAEPPDPVNEQIFAHLQQCRAAKLVEPVGEEHMYWAAMRNKSCRLTPLGGHYWRLANEGRI